MAFLVVVSLTVPVASSGVSKGKEEVGDRARSLDGTMRQTVRAWKRTWTVRTAPMLRADADALETALQSSAVVACSGDLLGSSMNLFPEFKKWDGVLVAGSHRAVLEFDLHET